MTAFDNSAAINALALDCLTTRETAILAWHNGKLLFSDGVAVVRCLTGHVKYFRLLPSGEDISGSGRLGWCIPTQQLRKVDLWDMLAQWQVATADMSLKRVVSGPLAAAGRERQRAIYQCNPKETPARYLKVNSRYLDLVPDGMRVRVDWAREGVLRFWRGDKVFMVLKPFGHRTNDNPWFTAEEVLTGQCAPEPAESEANA